jgi:sulfite reductase alpha subunit-like flavoprotein
VKKIFESSGLEMFDVEELSTHGGSLRIYAKHKDDNTKSISENVNKMIQQETDSGMGDLEYYRGFQQKAFAIKLDLLKFLVHQKQAHKKVAAYGAAAKGNTLLNYCGIKNDLVEFVVDKNPHKQNRWLPASHIRVVDEEHLKKEKPDFVIIFPWNLKEEIMQQLSYVKSWGATFVIPIPVMQLI